MCSMVYYQGRAPIFAMLGVCAMDLKKSKRLILILAVIYWVFAIGIYAIANEQFRYCAVTGEAPAGAFSIGEIVDGMEVRQKFEVPADVVNGIEVYAGTYDRANTGSITFSLLDSQDSIVVQKTVDVSFLENNKYTAISFDQELTLTPGDILTLRVTTQGCSDGNAITVFAGSTVKAGEVALRYAIDGQEAEGTLCIRLCGYDHLSFYSVYWIIVAVVFLAACVYVAYCWKGALQGKSNPLVSVCTVYSRYSFLIKQLVSRDFKTKYKRSSLGMAWSFLNPLLTMSVQYVVFSTLFKSDIPNYPVYLLTGIIFFSFFNEAVTMGMGSITGNASLIKKVYMPKYIYPVSRILSSLVNFAFALMPLFLVMIVTGTTFGPSMLLLIFDILCLLAFIIGMTLLLTTAMTFFQDTQFLWSVVGMMWQYMTPVFYPETIIPANILPLYRLNPMYQYITFARTCIIDGISPGPSAYFYCVISAVLVLLLGIVVFKKHQNKFVLYL